MNVLVCGQGENLVLGKSKAFKYKELDFTGVSCGQAFHMDETENSLVAHVDSTKNADDVTYSIITDEFGLYAMSERIHAKVKVSFCDNGKMIVDLLDGIILIHPEDEIMSVSKNITEAPEVVLDRVLWVDANMILEYAQYWGTLKSNHIQDFEFVLDLKGEKRGTLESFGLKHIKEETIDISGGHIAMLEMEMRKKEEEREKKEMLHNQAVNVQNGFADLVSQYKDKSYEFDDDDEEFYDEEFDDEEFDGYDDSEEEFDDYDDYDYDSRR